jgi:hypothetical protein
MVQKTQQGSAKTHTLKELIRKELSSGLLSVS